MTVDREPDPPLGSWRRAYTVVVVSTLVLLMLLYWFTATYNLPLEAR